MGTGDSKKQKPALEKEGENITRWIGCCPIRKDADVLLVVCLKT